MICDKIGKRASQIKSMPRRALAEKREQVAIVKKNYEIEPVVPDRTKAQPKDVGMVYAPYKPPLSLTPRNRDVTEMIDKNRPFLCRVTRIAGEDRAACYTPGTYYDFTKRERERLQSSMRHFGISLKRKYGVGEVRTLPEEEMLKYLRSELIYARIRTDKLAPKILDTCIVF